MTEKFIFIIVQSDGKKKDRNGRKRWCRMPGNLFARDKTFDGNW